MSKKFLDKTQLEYYDNKIKAEIDKKIEEDHSTIDILTSDPDNPKTGYMWLLKSTSTSSS